MAKTHIQPLRVLSSSSTGCGVSSAETCDAAPTQAINASYSGTTATALRWNRVQMTEIGRGAPHRSKARSSRRKGMPSRHLVTATLACRAGP